jgi:DUF3047 family protein
MNDTTSGIGSVRCGPPRRVLRLRIPRLLGGALLVAFVLGVVGGGPPPLRADEPCLVVEDFAKAAVGEFPSGWKGRKDSAKNVYAVAEDAKDIGVQAAKKLEWDLAAYPVLTWAWRPQEFPKGADERSGKNDSALAVYAVFPHTSMSVKSVKYIWSEKVPKGTHIPQTHGNTQGLVLRSGGELNGWVQERVNVLEDYKRYFKTDQAPKPEGIAVLTDSDDTSSRARGDYAMFRVCRG